LLCKIVLVSSKVRAEFFRIQDISLVQVTAGQFERVSRSIDWIIHTHSFVSRTGLMCGWQWDISDCTPLYEAITEYGTVRTINGLCDYYNLSSSGNVSFILLITAFTSLFFLSFRMDLYENLCSSNIVEII
jgi:hypothetical protein